jgi:uncharacterized OsmC-like protein
MVASDKAQRLNGVDVEALREYTDEVAADSTRADRDPVVIAHWVGGTRAEVVSTLGGAPVYMGGDDDPSAMGMLLRTLAACDVEVVANKAALLGVAIEELSVEARGHFNIQRYLGFDVDHDSGYESISYTVHLKTRGATEAQLDEIRHACEHGSPVTDTLLRAVPVSASFDIS